MRPSSTLLAAALALAGAAPAHAQETRIQPGAAIISGSTGCTMSWIVDGRPDTPQQGRTYGMTAAHCVAGVGSVVELAPPELTSSGGRERIGVVAFHGDPRTIERDFAFFEIDGEDLTQVDPSVKGHPSFPTGLPRHPLAGDTMQFSGYGDATYAAGAAREGRTGLLTKPGDREHAITGPISTGDSGGPVVDVTDGGTAFGVVTSIGAGVQPESATVLVAGEFGVNLRWALAEAASRGFHVRLRTASGAPAADDDEQ